MQGAATRGCSEQQHVNASNNTRMQAATRSSINPRVAAGSRALQRHCTHQRYVFLIFCLAAILLAHLRKRDTFARNNRSSSSSSSSSSSNNNNNNSSNARFSQALQSQPRELDGVHRGCITQEHLWRVTCGV